MAIKISDKGGGIPRSGMERLWTYTFTTAGKTKEKLNQISLPGGGGGGRWERGRRKGVGALSSS